MVHICFTLKHSSKSWPVISFTDFNTLQDKKDSTHEINLEHLPIFPKKLQDTTYQ